MLFNLALGNIRRNFRNYWAYFLSSAFSVFVLYLFLSVVYGKSTTDVASYQTTRVLFAIGAVLTALFAAFFMWYSNSFFVKSRKKEFATYMLLGMSKGQTVRLNFLENLAILVLAFASGIAGGMLLNKFLIMLLFHIMRENAYVPFEVNLQALKVCAYVYAGVFALTAAHGALLLMRNSLLSLIQASKRSEKAMRVTAWTWVVGALALLFLGEGYYLSAALGANVLTWPPIVFFVVVGTVLLFAGAVALFLHFSRKNEPKLYRGARLVTVSQLMHRYRGNVGALSVIAVTTSVALCAVLSCCGLYAKTADNTRGQRPFSLEYADGNGSLDSVVEAAVKDHPEVAVKSRAAFTLLRVYDGAGQDARPAWCVIGESAYNAVMEAQGRPNRASVSGEAACMLVQYNNIGTGNKQALKEASLPLGDNTVQLRIESSENRLFYSLDRFTRTLVVKDSMYDAFLQAPNVRQVPLVGLVLNDDAASGGFVADLRSRMPAESKLLTYQENFIANLQMMGVLMFVGVFIGLLFIAATGGILYFRMAMEAAEDREKFVTLARVGMSAKELRGAVAKELAVVFAAPFALAALNTYMARFPLERIVNLNMTDTFFVMLALYGALYGLYYLLTLHKYVKTVSA